MLDEQQVLKIQALWHQIKASRRLNICDKDDEHISDIEYQILCLLEQNPNPLIKDISKHINVPNSTLTNALNRLEKKAFIERRMSDIDRRSYCIVMTENGQKKQQSMASAEREIISNILFLLNDDEKSNLLQILEKISDSFRV